MSGKLKTAVLGLDDKGLLLLEAVGKCPYLQLQALADKDLALAEKTAKQYNCTAYDDYRQLVIQNHFDCLLVAAGLYCCDEYIKAAMKKKFNILKLAPPARNFEEAAEFVRFAEEQDIKFAVANPARFSKSFIKLQQLLQQDRFEQIFLISALCTVAGKVKVAWQNDPKLAGGGVLLRNCYPLIELITSNFKLPQQVYALNTNQALDRQQRLYLTEDTAVVTMKFSDRLSVNLIASRAFGTEQMQLKLYSKNNIVTVNNSQLLISDNSAKILERFRYDDDSDICHLTKLLENFALSILSPDENKSMDDTTELLSSMAVIEAAYLSARTAMPEEPQRILEMELNEPTSIWPANKNKK